MLLKLCLFALAGALVSAVAAAAAPEEEAVAVKTAEITTNKGVIKVELYADKAPASVENFIGYATSGYYDGTIFHRVIPGFMIQGGGFTPDMTQKPSKAPIVNEANNGLKNSRGTLAMARTSDVNSASSQFFVNLVDNAFLDYRNSTPAGYGYCVFGKVVQGMDIVDAIAKTKTATKGLYQDVPVDAVVIKSITVK